MTTKTTTKSSKQPAVQSPTRIGNKVFICTVTKYYTGKIVGLSKEEILLADAAWIPDTGRFAQGMASGSMNEVEPYPAEAIVAVQRGGVIDVSDWLHDLPRATK